MNTADPLTATALAASVAVLMVYAGIGKRMLAWRVARRTPAAPAATR